MTKQPQRRQPRKTGREAIKCATTGKVLGVLDERYMYLWCRLCGMEHAYTWDEIGKLMLPQGEQKAVKSGEL